VGGIFVLLPIVLLYLLLSEMLELVVAIATPIADLFPEGTFDKIAYPTVIAVILIVGVSFLLGLFMRISWGRRIFDWLENRILVPIPGYSAVKSLKHSFGKSSAGQSFKPALLVDSNGQREIIYLIEKHAGGTATVLLPWAPTPLAGSVKIVPMDQVEILDSSLSDLAGVLSQWGVGMDKLLERQKGSA
jgi:uncharacterized membrane protein